MPDRIDYSELDPSKMSAPKPGNDTDIGGRVESGSMVDYNSMDPTKLVETLIEPIEQATAPVPQPSIDPAIQESYKAERDALDAQKKEEETKKEDDTKIIPSKSVQKDPLVDSVTAKIKEHYKAYGMLTPAEKLNELFRQDDELQATYKQAIQKNPELAESLSKSYQEEFMRRVKAVGLDMDPTIGNVYVKDEDKKYLENYTKFLIEQEKKKPGATKEDIGAWEKAANKAAATSARIFNTPYNAMAMIEMGVNELMEAAGRPELKTERYINEARARAQGVNEMSQKGEYLPDTEITELLASGDNAAAIKKTAIGVAEQIPNILLLLTGGGVVQETTKYGLTGTAVPSVVSKQVARAGEVGAGVAMAGPAAAANFVDNMDKDAAYYYKVLNAVVNGMSEWESEMLTTIPILRNVGKAISRQGFSTFRETAKDALAPAYERAFKSVTGWVYPAVMEGLGEVSNQLVQDLSDIATGMDPNKKIGEGYGDVFLISAIAGKVMSSPGDVANFINSRGKVAIREAYNRTPDDYSIENRIKSTELFLQRDALEYKMKKIDKLLHPKFQEQIAGIENKLIDIAKQEGYITEQDTEQATTAPTKENVAQVTEEQLKEAGIIQAEVDDKIKEAQTRLKLPETPDIIISESTEETLSKIDSKEPVINERLKSAADDLYAEYKKLEAMKNSDTRLYTTEQIEAMQQELELDITNLNNKINEQTETGEFKTEEVKPAEQAEVSQAAAVGEGENIEGAQQQEEVVAEKTTALPALLKNETGLSSEMQKEIDDNINFRMKPDSEIDDEENQIRGGVIAARKLLNDLTPIKNAIKNRDIKKLQEAVTKAVQMVRESGRVGPRVIPNPQDRMQQMLTNLILVADDGWVNKSLVEENGRYTGETVTGNDIDYYYNTLENTLKQYIDKNSHIGKSLLSPGDIFSTKAYRVESNLSVNNISAKDVIDFEADELDNEEVRTQAESVAKNIGIDLKNVGGGDIIWVTSTQKDAKRYGEKVEEVNIPDGSVILGVDGYGGYLILKNTDNKYIKINEVENTAIPEVTEESKPEEKAQPIAAQITSKDVKITKSKSFTETGVHEVKLNGKTIGKMFYDRSISNDWRDPAKKTKGPSDNSDFLGNNRAEAIQAIVDRYNAKNAKKQPVAQKEISAKEQVKKPSEGVSEGVKTIGPQNLPNMTEDNEGNFVFYHQGPGTYTEIDPKKSGSNKRGITSREELSAMNSVGGMSMYNTDSSHSDGKTTGNTHLVKVPKDKVYDLDLDPENFKADAEARFKEENPDLGYSDNHEVAWMTKIAEENGYDMTVVKWNKGTRAQTTKVKPVVDTQIVTHNAITKDFEESYKSNRVKQKEVKAKINNSSKTTEFFSDVIEGVSPKFKPFKPWASLERRFSYAQSKFKEIFDDFKGNFDEHIATSIPFFRETQIKVGSAIATMFSEGGLVYDIGGTEGGFVKAISKSSKGKIQSINLDTNEAAKKSHNKKPVKGSKFVKEAFYESFTEKDGTVHKKHVPEEKADVVHESMVFQFIGPSREGFVNEVADNYLKEDGIFITEEKILPDTQEEWETNEKKKDQYKLQYYTQEQVDIKRKEILEGKEDAFEGMKANQTPEVDLLEALSNKFKYVRQYWDSGNFKGYIASNNKDKIDQFMTLVDSNNHEYSTRDNNELVNINNGNDTNKGLRDRRTEAKNKIANGLNDLMSAMGGLTEATGAESKKVLDALRQIADGVYELGVVNLEDFVNKMNDYVSKYITDPKQRKKLLTTINDNIDEVEKLYVEKSKPRRFAEKLLDTRNISPEVKDGMSEDSKNYIPTGNDYSLEEARLIIFGDSRLGITGKGLDAALLMTQDMNNGISPRTRVTLSIVLMEELNAIVDQGRVETTFSKEVDKILSDKTIKKDAKLKSLIDLIKTGTNIEELTKLKYGPITGDRKEGREAVRKRIEYLNANPSEITREDTVTTDAKKAITDSTRLAESLSMLGTALGQGVQAFSIWARLHPRTLREMTLKEFRKQGITLTPDQMAELDVLVANVEKAPEGFQKTAAITELLKFQVRVPGIPVLDLLQSVWYANILSGYSTQLLNILANAANTLMEIPISIAMHGTGAHKILAGLFQGYGKGLLEAWSVLKTGYSPIKQASWSYSPSSKQEMPSLLEVYQGVKFAGVKWNLLYPLKFVRRAMLGVDTLFYHGLKGARAQEYMHMNQFGKNPKTTREVLDYIEDNMLNRNENLKNARDKAKAEGLSGQDYQRRVWEIMDQSLPEEMLSDLHDFASRGTFNYPPEGRLGLATDTLSGLTNRFKAFGTTPLKFVVPFTTILSNVANNNLDWSPYGLLRAGRGMIGNKNKTLKEGEKKEYSRKYTAEERSREYIKGTVGTLGMGVVLLMAKAAAEDDPEDPWFAITANGSGDYRTNYNLQETGWQRYSVKIGKKWYSYANTPLAIPFAVIGSFRDLDKYKGDKIQDDPLFTKRTTLALWASVQYFQDLTFLRGLSDFFTAIGESNSSQSGNYFTKFGTTLVKGLAVPNLVTQVSRKVQEVYDMPAKEAEGLYEQLVKDIPYARRGLNDMINGLGETVVPNTHRWVNKVNEDPIWKLIVDNNAWITKPARRDKDMVIYDKDFKLRTLNEDEYYSYAKLRGQLIKKDIEKNFKKLEKMDGAEVREAIKGYIEDAGKKARKELVFGSHAKRAAKKGAKASVKLEKIY